MTTTQPVPPSVAHRAVRRARQARTLAVRTQLALTLAQVLLWVSLIGGVVGVAALLWTRLRANTRATTPAPQTVTSDTADPGLP